MTPVFIAEVFRHGARTPTKNYLNEDYVNQFGLENLTGNGERQHFVLGSYIKLLYPDLFDFSEDPQNFNDDFIVMYSS
jgi:hypothetical protein